MTELSTHEKGKWLVIGDGTIDEMQASGRWIKTDFPIDLDHTL